MINNDTYKSLTILGSSVFLLIVLKSSLNYLIKKKETYLKDKELDHKDIELDLKDKELDLKYKELDIQLKIAQLNNETQLKIAELQNTKSKTN